MKNKCLFLIWCLLFILPLISANGLIISPTIIDINKTQGIDNNFNISICNTETFSFQDIKFEDNSYLSISPFNLSSSECKNISINIIATDNFNGNLRFKGQFISNLGQQNIIHNLNVDYVNGISKCDFSIIEGDSIIWNNQVSSSINLVNGNTNAIITTLNQNSSYAYLFSSPITFRYYFTRIGYRFTSICSITSLDTNGLIQDPEKDAVLTINLKHSYIPTVLNIIILNNNYSINAGYTAQDIFNVKNNGNFTAKNIYLNGEWFSFSSNNFDLAPGESKNIGYTIYPIVFNTSQTNQSYIKNMTITGNFDTFNFIFNINIPYSLIIGNLSQNSQTLEALVTERVAFILAYCSVNPNNADCSKVMTKYTSILNQTDDSQTEFIKALINFMDSEDAYRNVYKLMLDNMNQSIFNAMSQTSDNTNNIKLILDGQDSYGTAMWSIVVILIVITILAIVFLIFDYFKKNKHKDRNTYY